MGSPQKRETSLNDCIPILSMEEDEQLRKYLGMDTPEGREALKSAQIPVLELSDEMLRSKLSKILKKRNERGNG